MHAAPRDAGILLGHLHLAKRGHDVGAIELVLIKPGAGLDLLRFHCLAAERHLDQFG